MNEQIKIALIKKRLKQAQMSVDLQIHHSRLSGIINGWIKPSTVEKDRISAYLEIPMEDLFPQQKGVCDEN